MIDSNTQAASWSREDCLDMYSGFAVAILTDAYV